MVSVIFITRTLNFEFLKILFLTKANWYLKICLCIGLISLNKAVPTKTISSVLSVAEMNQTESLPLMYLK